MARTHSTHTPSPIRKRSPARLAASEDGSQYEMDLDALGLNSTFESTALEEGYEVPERVEESEVEGPEDFTVNMTYWMTADLGGVKSRKEAQAQAQAQADAERHATTTTSPTVRVDNTVNRDLSMPTSDRSMAHDEKVRSFLSALPDTDLDQLPNGTPLRANRTSVLQLPRSSPPKPRSLQPTVEDVDTPRKPTQQTVIHHPSPKPSSDRLADLQSRLDQQELASRTRITELETILSFTRTELETTRNENYKQKDSIARLGDGHKTELQRLAETLKQEHERTLQVQRESLERQLRDLETSNREANDRAESKARELESAQQQLAQKHSAEQKHDQQTEQASAEKTELINKLTSVQARADSLQLDLARATAEAKAAREESQAREAIHAASQSSSSEQLARMTSLKSQLKDARFSLECAQADVAAKEQLLSTNLSLNADLRALRSELDAQRPVLADLNSKDGGPIAPDEQSAKDQLVEQHVAEKDDLQRQLNTAQGRIAGLESSLASLRAQLADAHRETGTVRAETERLTQDLADANDRLIDARAEADRRVADVEKKVANLKDLKVEAESRLRELKSQHDDLAEGHAAMLEDVRSKAEDAVLKTGALLTQERKEKTKLKKEIERLQHEINDRTFHDHKYPPSDYDSDTDTNTNLLPSHPDPRDTELASLKSTLNSTLSHLKSLKKQHAAALLTLRAEITTLHTRLETQARDHAAINAALDEQLAALLNKVVKERTRALVGKRDGQWEILQREVAQERELLGRVVLRQWGREEIGVTEEKGGQGRGQGQIFGYKFVRREG